MLTLTTDKCGAFRVRKINFHACDPRTMLASTTDQCGARSGLPQLIPYRSRESNFCVIRYMVRDARTMLVSTTDQCGARSGLPQLIPYRSREFNFCAIRYMVRYSWIDLGSWLTIAS